MQNFHCQVYFWWLYWRFRVKTQLKSCTRYTIEKEKLLSHSTIWKFARQSARVNEKRGSKWKWEEKCVNKWNLNKIFFFVNHIQMQSFYSLITFSYLTFSLLNLKMITERTSLKKYQTNKSFRLNWLRSYWATFILFSTSNAIVVVWLMCVHIFFSPSEYI